jgi:hypothetical protein
MNGRYTAVYRPQHTLVLLIVPKTNSLIRFAREMRALHWRAVARLDVGAQEGPGEAKAGI